MEKSIYVFIQVKEMIFCKKRAKKRSKDESEKNTEYPDIWNVPLATAVAQLNNQKVVHSLIQVVVYACT